MVSITEKCFTAPTLDGKSEDFDISARELKNFMALKSMTYKELFVMAEASDREITDDSFTGLDGTRNE